MDRKTLEEMALQAVCACSYYDLADYLEITTDSELLAIIDGKASCNGHGL